MSTIDQEHLEFRGNGAEACENFIAGVIKYAFAQGKQRDDAWMADFAATCMTQNALRWWGSLEEDTQQSWKLLQKEMLLAYPPMFHGRSGEEAENFVQMVYRQARDAKRQSDARWIVQFVQTCLAGEALRWYATLEADVQDNWKLLQQAILNRWPGNGVTPLAISSSSICPTPAAAAAPIPPAYRQKGRIRIDIRGDQRTHYLSNSLDPNGFLTLLTNHVKALVVELEPASGGLWKLCIAEGQSIEYESLAIWWLGSPSVEFVAFPPPIWDFTNHASLCAADSQAGKGSANPKYFKGPILTAIWRLPIDSSNDVVTSCKLTATNDGGDLFTYANADSVVNFSRFTEGEGDPSDLYFEPV